MLKQTDAETFSYLGARRHTGDATHVEVDSADAEEQFVRDVVDAWTRS
jgi:hypothetical protein